MRKMHQSLYYMLKLNNFWERMATILYNWQLFALIKTWHSVHITKLYLENIAYKFQDLRVYGVGVFSDTFFFSFTENQGFVKVFI